jgi:hypothetical protein
LCGNELYKAVLVPLAIGLAAFALIPTKELRVVKPSKPMFFYITQLLQAQVGGCLWSFLACGPFFTAAGGSQALPARRLPS